MSLLQRAATAAFGLLALVGLGLPTTASFAAEPATILTLPTLNAVESAPVPMVQPIPSESPAPVAADRAGDVTAYPTLAAAVAAQATTDSDEQLRCLATSVYFESKGEPLGGQLAVAEVILNRAQAGRFGNSVCAVVTQPGQFSFVRGGTLPSVDSSRPAYRTALAIARVAMAAAWDSAAPNALYFHARRAAPGWKRTRVAAIGNHVFYR